MKHYFGNTFRKLLFRTVIPAVVVVAGVVVPGTGCVATAAGGPPASTGARFAATGDPHTVGGGVVYYVDAVNGNDSAVGTGKSTAWKTLGRVSTASLTAGSVVAFKRGDTFSGSAAITASGTSAAPLTITAYGTGTPPKLTNPGGWNMLQVAGSHVEVSQLLFSDGVVFDNSDGKGITGPKYKLSGAIAITDNAADTYVHDNEFTQVGVGVKTYGVGTRVEYNSIHDLQIAFRGVDSGSDTSYGAIGVSLDNSSETVRYNRFVNCRSTDSPYGADGGAVEIEGFDQPKNDISIDHNYSSGTQGFLEVTETSSSNVTVAYNLSDDYQQFVAFDTTTTPSGYTVTHNTVLRTRDNSALFDIYYYREDGPPPADNWLSITDNIFVNPNAVLMYKYDWPHSDNLVTGSVGYPLGQGDLTADPRFVDTTSTDYRLSSTSPAIDNASAGASGTDLDGLPASVGLRPDMGAFEYQQDPAAGANVVADGGFESQTVVSPTSLPWYAEGALSAGIDVNVGHAHSGQDNGWITAEASTAWGALKQNVPVQAQSTYRFIIWTRNSGNIDGGWLGVKTSSGSVLNEVRHGMTGSVYVPVVLTVATGSNTSVSVYAGFYGPGSPSWEQLDDVVLQKLA